MQDALSYAKIFAVFDCCRVNLTNMPGLAMGRGVGDDGNDDYGDEDEESMCKYFHI